MMYEDEVELAPGIYLTKRKDPITPQPTSKQDEMFKSNPQEHLEYLKSQIQRTQTTISQLLYSNQEMLLADPSDPIYTEAIAENKVFIQKHEDYVRELQVKGTEVCKMLGVCLVDEFKIDGFSKEPEVDGQGGIYL